MKNTKSLFRLFTLVTICIAIASPLYTQTTIPGDTLNDSISTSYKVYDFAEVMPTFPGGTESLYSYFSKNIQYPKKARKNGIEGTVYVSYVVEGDGSISNVNILRGIGGGCDEEAYRVVKEMPKWNPGMQDGKPVAVEYKVPIKFTLTKNGRK